MKVLKIVLILIVVIIAIVLILGLFTKKDYAVEREITINKPSQQVYDYIRYLGNQRKYNKWVMMDPNLRITETGTDGTVGYITRWDSDMKEAGKGEQEIKALKEGERTDVEVRFIKPFEGIAQTHMTTESLAPGQTKVKWAFTSGMKYPMNVMLLFVDIPGMLGKDVDTSLNNLKAVLEKQ